MKITLEQLVSSREALDELGAAKGLPFKTAYWCGRVLKKAANEIADWDQARGKVLNELGAKPNAETNRFDFPTSEAEAEFHKQATEILAEEIELPGDGIKVDQFGEATLSPASLAVLDWLIVE